MEMRLVVLFLAVSPVLLASAARAARPDWYWDSSHAPESTVIDKTIGDYVAQNPSVVLLDSGKLAMVYSHNTYTSDAVCGEFDLRAFVSSDGGHTWLRRHALPPRYLPVEDNYPRPAALLHDGSLVAIQSKGWENFDDTPEKRRELTDQGYYVFTPDDGNAKGVISIIRTVLMNRSTDRGRTWRKSEIKLPVFTPHIANYGDDIVLRDGTLVQPMWGRLDVKREPFVSAMALRSTDNAKTWELSYLARATDFDFNETSITQAANGDLVALMRTTGQHEPVSEEFPLKADGQRELWTAVSKDGGKTWRPAKDSGLRGSTPWVITTSDGLVVAVFVRRWTNPGGGAFTHTGVYAAVSRDHGQTWDAQHQVRLLDAGDEFVCGYPSACALPDGSVYAVYSFRADSPFFGGRAIGGVRFHPRNPAFGGK